ncbi:hypothetical protein ASG47_06840 [Devosia sp. Leaf420]|uniref:GFA family protein n=1 Tax=Devosia sp. Leaf420 TaxID=1736374 RepID=UPI000715CC36|nr:hypothetical protein [Devosia sp. Leaf420]KQT48092.1 hypothetical protein ASG47_06840 [Devosia sp. Leaf420]
MAHAEHVLATCHCGSVSIRLPKAPAEITHCNCSLCRRYGVLWTYYAIADVTITSEKPTDTYAWNGKNVDFHRCSGCGCVTHWYPRKASRESLGVNGRLLDPEILAAAQIRYKDDAGTGLFI